VPDGTPVCSAQPDEQPATANAQVRGRRAGSLTSSGPMSSGQEPDVRGWRRRVPAATRGAERPGRDRQPLHEFEEGELPRRLWRITLRSRTAHTPMTCHGERSRRSTRLLPPTTSTAARASTST
jgi:hypothetical protein